MNCKRCPHHVRHGKVAEDRTTIAYTDLCGLKVKQLQDHEPQAKKTRGRGRPVAEVSKKKTMTSEDNTDCIHHPFPSEFDYFICKVYQETFESKGFKNGVIPTKDFQYSERLAGISVTDMELL